MVNELLRTATKLTLMGARTVGAYSLVKRSRWRTQRLLILCYHGISLRDEHLWRPGLFMSPELFTKRMDAIKRMGCKVLPLDLAIDRLQSGTLSPLSVVITFDDGFYNFFAAAYPILRKFEYPATVYQTTFYAGWNRPVFHLLCHYLLWKASGQAIDAYPIIRRQGFLDLRTREGIDAANLEIWNFARSSNICVDERQALAQKLAEIVGADYQELAQQRLFHLMNRGELCQMVQGGVDLQLHTHRHRVPTDQRLFIRELNENQGFLRDVGQPNGVHFTYPSGLYRTEVFSWLSEFGIRSATTCDTGLASIGSNFMCLPRFVDTSQTSNLEFEAWLSGMRTILPNRAHSKAQAGA